MDNVRINVEEGIQLLNKICYHELNPDTLLNKYIIPISDPNSQLLVDALNIKLAVRCKNVPLKNHYIFFKTRKQWLIESYILKNLTLPL